MALPDLTDQFIADSYPGVLHTSNTPIINFDLPPVYDGLGNKSALRLGKDGYGVSINGSLSANNLAIAGYDTIINYLYPVGSVYFSADNVNPQSRFTGTVWTRIANGRFIVGVGGDTDSGGISKTFTAGENDGEYRHKLLLTETPPHTHRVRSTTGGGSVDRLSDNDSVLNGFGSGNGVDDRGYQYYTADNPIIQSAGGVGGEALPHENTPPGFGLYIWQRTA